MRRLLRPVLLLGAVYAVFRVSGSLQRRLRSVSSGGLLAGFAQGGLVGTVPEQGSGEGVSQPSPFRDASAQPAKKASERKPPRSASPKPTKKPTKKSTKKSTKKPAKKPAAPARKSSGRRAPR